MKRISILLMVVTLLYSAPASAQKPLKKPEKPQTQTQTAPTTKSSSKSSSAKSSTQSSASKSTADSINGHEYVDLGLSVKWATCNVGASSPSEYGDYFAWGETRTKPSYDEENCVTYGKSMGSIAGDSQYDAARANWGGTWRLPTASEIGELIDKCKWVWVTQGGHNGYKVTGPNGNSIFLPAAGYRSGTSLHHAGDRGVYWSATPDEDDTHRAYGLRLDGGGFGGNWGDRYYGPAVRPVSE